jgi:hypothetical protein
MFRRGIGDITVTCHDGLGKVISNCGGGDEVNGPLKFRLECLYRVVEGDEGGRQHLGEQCREERSAAWVGDGLLLDPTRLRSWAIQQAYQVIGEGLTKLCTLYY